MQRATGQQKRKGKKTYNQLITEAKRAVDEAIAKAQHIIAENYIPELCEALKDENYKHIDLETSEPEKIMKMCNSIKAQVTRDCHWWSPDNIRHYWPEWLKDQYFVDLARANNEKRRAALVEKISTREEEKDSVAQSELNLLSSVMHDVKISRAVQNSFTGIEPEEPEQRDIETQLAPEMQSVGEEGKSVMEIYGEIIKSADALSRALTQQERLPAINEDVILDYVKPTRPARKAFVEELKTAQFLSINSLQRSLAYLDYVLGDMLEILEDTQR